MSTSSMKSPEIDEEFYSRQLYVLGKEAMHRLANAHVLISGMRGLGVEIAKNIILGGAKSVIIHDCGKVDFPDLSSQYYFAESDIGQNRAEIALKKLSELNSHVTVTSSSEIIDEIFLANNKVNVFVLTDANLDDQTKVGDYCHKHDIKFINANTKGLFGQIFCDFGEDFQVLDTNGKDPITQIVTEISHDEVGVVFMRTDTQHGFEEGSYVKFNGVKGMSEVNGQEFKISVPSRYTFTIGGTSKFGIYTGGGTVTEVKKPEVLHFKSFSQSLVEPEMFICDFSKKSMSVHLHLAFQVLSYFEKQYGVLPKPWDDTDAEQFYELVEKLNLKNRDKPLTDELNKHWIKLFAKTCTGDLCPMQAIIGGIVAQETMKAVTGNFMPIRQFFYFDAIECLPEDIFEPLNDISKSRYYSQEIVFGKDFQNKLGRSKYFVVGTGSIGCEILKNFAMMGIGCNKDGAVFVSDMNSIKKLHLNRHFLFRSWDIGKMKSKIAAEALKTINSDMNIRVYIEGVVSETEDIYHDDLFEELDAVINTCDNRQAHHYIDTRCVYNRTPLIDSSTISTKASVQVIIPFLTESYSPTNDSSDVLLSMGAVGKWPFLIDHTVVRASDNFASLFTTPVQQAQQFLHDPKEFAEQTFKYPSIYVRNEIIENIKRILDSERPKNFVDCIKWSRNLFEQQFHNTIAQILHNFSRDQLTSTSELFWGGYRRYPRVLKFDVNYPVHLDFIIAASNLLAYIYYIPQVRNRQYIAEEVSKIQVPEFQPNSYVATSENDQILDYLPKYNEIRDIQIRAHEFGKDDDTNFHIDYIVATANLLAENYEIQPADRSKIERIAGNIIPTIVTTTAMVAGFVCLEVYKLIQGHKNIESYRNTSVNLALPFFGFSAPIPAKQQKYLDRDYTLWDRFDIQNDMTLEEFIEYFKKEHKLVPSMVSSRLFLLYAPLLMRQPKRPNDMKRKISEIYETVSKTKIPSHIRSLILDMMCEDLEGNDIEDVPYVKYTFR